MRWQAVSARLGWARARTHYNANALMHPRICCNAAGIGHAGEGTGTPPEDVRCDTTAACGAVGTGGIHHAQTPTAVRFG